MPHGDVRFILLRSEGLKTVTSRHDEPVGHGKWRVVGLEVDESQPGEATVVVRHVTVLRCVVVTVWAERLVVMCAVNW